VLACAFTILDEHGGGKALGTKTETHQFDDLNPDLPSHETIVFSLRDKTYTIDLNKVHVVQMDDALAPFIAVARPVAAASARQRNRKSVHRETSAACRAWLKTQPDIPPVKERGRIPEELVERWRAAGSPRVTAPADPGSFQTPTLS
jgi:Lsr2